MLRPVISKAFMGGGNYHLGREVLELGKKPLLQGHSASLGATTIAQNKHSEKKRTKKQSRRADVALGAAGGAAAGQFAYHEAGYAGKYYNRVKNDPKIYNDPITHRSVKHPDGTTSPPYKKPEYKVAMEGRNKKNPGHKKKYGFASGDPKKMDKKGFTRNYPKELPGYKIVRGLGYTHHGKTGLAIGGAVAAAGAVVGGKSAGKHWDKKHKEKVTKIDFHTPQVRQS